MHERELLPAQPPYGHASLLPGDCVLGIVPAQDVVGADDRADTAVILGEQIALVGKIARRKIKQNFFNILFKLFKLHTEYVVTEKDILAGSVKNIALADGKDPNGDKPDVTPGEKEDKTVPENSHLTVTKKTVSSPKNRSGYAAGETIRYRIEAVNDGNLTLTEIEVTDPLTGDTWKVEKLAPGEKQTFETKYTVTEKDQSVGKVVNEATAKGKTPGSTELIVVPGKTSDPVLPKAAAAVTVSNTVQTGDPTQTGAYLAMLFVAAAGIGILAKKKKKERRK